MTIQQSWQSCQWSRYCCQIFTLIGWAIWFTGELGTNAFAIMLWLKVNWWCLVALVTVFRGCAPVSALWIGWIGYCKSIEVEDPLVGADDDCCCADALDWGFVNCNAFANLRNQNWHHPHHNHHQLCPRPQCFCNPQKFNSPLKGTGFHAHFPIVLILMMTRSQWISKNIYKWNCSHLIHGIKDTISNGKQIYVSTKISSCPEKSTKCFKTLFLTWPPRDSDRNHIFTDTFFRGQLI